MNDRTFTTAGLLVFFALVVAVASRCEPSAAAPRQDALRMTAPAVPSRAPQPGCVRGVLALSERAADLRITAEAVGVPADSDVRSPRTASPLADGRYEFTELPAGVWRIRVLRGSAVLQSAELVVPGGGEVLWPR